MALRSVIAIHENPVRCILLESPHPPSSGSGSPRREGSLAHADPPMTEACSARLCPSRPLPPYSYVPGHDHPHPVTDSRGHLYGREHASPFSSEPPSLAPFDRASRRALAALLYDNQEWRYALDLFNAGYYWESHEAWEHFWHALGRTTPEAAFVQGLIRLAAACVKTREGRAEGVKRHTHRARELLGDFMASCVGGEGSATGLALGLDPESILAVLQELGRYRPECWHTSRTPVVRVLAARLRLAGEEARR